MKMPWADGDSQTSARIWFEEKSFSGAGRLGLTRGRRRDPCGPDEVGFAVGIQASFTVEISVFQIYPYHQADIERGR